MSDTKMPESFDAPALLDSELRQFLSRLMAGYEGAHRRLADHADSLAAQLAAANAIAAKSLEMQVALVAEHEQMVSQRHTRDLEATLAKQKAEAFGQVTADVRAVAMLAGKKFLGVPLTGNDTHGLQDLLKTLSPDQIDSLMTNGKLELSVPQRQLLTNTLMSLAEGERKEEPQAAE